MFQPPLAKRLPPEGAPEGAALDAFLDYVGELGLTLYDAQEQAILEIFGGSHVLLTTPTGSGKTLVAEAALFDALQRGGRAFYTAPIKALASEKFFQLVGKFGAERVGLMTGDATVNHDAPIVCATAEVLANIALREGRRADVTDVVMDEFHYYADKDRGVAWQVPLLELPDARFVLMSGTFGDTGFFEKELHARTGRSVAAVHGMTRPVPLSYEYKEKPLHETVLELVRQDRAPIYLVGFTQRGAAEEAQNLLSLDLCSKDERKAIKDALAGVRLDSPYGKEMARFLQQGIGVHHAGLLPKYRLLVEKLAGKGLLKVVCGTDTLGVGVNVPIRTVLLTRLCKFDGEKVRILNAREFHQIVGRAGRRGFDTQGFCVVQAPEHVIENLRLEAKAGDDPKKLRKIVRRKPPEKGYVHWDRQTFDRLVASTPEPLASRFDVSFAMLLELLTREEGGCLATARTIKRSHEPPAKKRIVGRKALEMFKVLRDAGVVRFAYGDDGGRRLVLSEDLSDDFALHHPLTLWLMDAAGQIDVERETYALDVLTLVESILENPEIVLMKQADVLKREKLFELKAAGVEFDDRKEELDKIEHPKPNADFVYGTYNAFCVRHPWAKTENVRPKSVARDLVEGCFGFAEYVKEYGLERAEGTLLRYLSDVYKALAQSVPPWAKNDELEDIQETLGAVVRQADASLLDEWERLKNPLERLETKRPEGDAPAEPTGSQDVTRDARAFGVLVRNAAFALVRALARGDTRGFVDAFEPDAQPMGRVVDELGAKFLEEHGALKTDADARGPKALTVVRGDDAWRVEQALYGDDGPSGWVVRATIPLAASRDAGRPVLRFESLGAE